MRVFGGVRSFRPQGRASGCGGFGFRTLVFWNFGLEDQNKSSYRVFFECNGPFSRRTMIGFRI